MALVCTNIISYNRTDLPNTTRRNLNETHIVKQGIAIINFTAIIAALYLYNRHNLYCESGVYSMFSFLEYIVIVANIVYHLQAYYDLSEYSIIVAKFELPHDNSQDKIDLLEKKRN